VTTETSSGQWKDRLKEEIAKGGKESPCPLCRLPRVRRSDYIRCCRCGVNWISGEALDKDPRTARQRKLVDDMTALALGKGKREDYARKN
jgi:uncharacterized Zn finger protein (UPF0148 family)